MFFKNIYNNLFSLSSYAGLIKKSLFKAVMYILTLSLLCGSAYATIGYIKLKPLMEDTINNIYEHIPEFSLSSKGLDIESDEPIIFSFAGVNLHVDGDRSFTELVINEKVDSGNEIIFVGKDGYGIVNGNTLKSGNLFANVKALQNIELTKDDFTIIYETIKMVNNDIVLIILALVVMVATLVTLLRSMLYAIILKMTMLLKNKKVSFKNAFKISLNGHTFYTIYWGIALYSSMNINVYYRLMFIEIISMVYIILIALTLNIDGGKSINENVKNKKRP